MATVTDGLRDEGAVVGVDVGEERFVGHVDLAGREAVHAEQLVGPGHDVAGDVPVPRPETGHCLGLGQLPFPLPERLLGPLLLSDVPGDPGGGDDSPSAVPDR